MLLTFSPWRQCPALGEAQGLGESGLVLVQDSVAYLSTCSKPYSQARPREGAPACTGEVRAPAMHTWCSPAYSMLCHPQMQQMYDMIMQHKRAMQDMQLLWEKALQQHQHGYDSDEEVDSELGTWEHQLRRMEMDKTRGALRQPGVWGAWLCAVQEAPLICWPVRP